ncbi:Piso0_005849 [Millerozyma farinosa CBS 7064]|uniref:Glutamyl-tRNA(Gln) amidotransferase subunit F, mitochondrial n=1 Tax=Pichia sorbitophila (strain ATCC MYA-4447 / BCRC 22081 / CBS 7064 / NBRC 10061 / NRRL Y-12695) TaxID=559304 RepID=G8Y332_PICSO|nr:Piso0_005849 [Millerozyma farinosa CBS 7064]
MMIRICKAIRYQPCFHYSTKVGQTLASEKDLKSYLEKSMWKVADLVSHKQSDLDKIKIDDKVIEKTLKCSGLEASQSDPNGKKKLISSLKAQMCFVQHLYEDSEPSKMKDENKNNTIFRLIASDHKPQDPLTLEKLMSDIEKLQYSVNASKGEEENSINIETLNGKASYFTLEPKKTDTL